MASAPCIRCGPRPEGPGSAPPRLPLGQELLLPDRHVLLDPVDRVPGGFERLGAVRTGHRHEHGGLPHVRPPGPMGEVGLAHGPLGEHLVRDLAHPSERQLLVRLVVEPGHRSLLRASPHGPHEEDLAAGLGIAHEGERVRRLQCPARELEVAVLLHASQHSGQPAPGAVCDRAGATTMDRMDERDDEPQIPIGDVLGEVPLFREIQRVLLSSTGPVNWELARQVGIAMASWGKEDPHPTDADREGLEGAVRTAELAISDLTGMPTPPQLAVVRADRRATWVEANITSLRELIEPVATKLSRVLTDVRKQATGSDPGGEAAMLEVLVDRMAPLLLGAQVGTVLGYLGQRVLGQFDVVVPRDTGALSFVVPNIAEFESEWSLPPVEFRTWVALHEVVHRF